MNMLKKRFISKKKKEKPVGVSLARDSNYSKKIAGVKKRYVI